MILDKESDVLENVPLKVKQLIHAIDKHPNYYEMTCSRAIPYVTSTIKNIHLIYNFFDEFYTESYGEISAIFEYLFRIFIKFSITNIYHPELLEE